MGAFSQLLAKHNVQVRRGATDNHRQQGIVERFKSQKIGGTVVDRDLLGALGEGPWAL